MGSELAGCMVSDMTLTTSGKSVRATLGDRWIERVVDVDADHVISIQRFDLGTSLAGTASDHAPEVHDLTNHEPGRPVAIDPRNHVVDSPLARTTDREAPTKFDFSMVEADPWELEKVAYPERPVAAGDTFDLQSQFIKRVPETVPVEHRLDVRFTVEHVEPGRSMQMTCAGTERATFHHATVRGDSTTIIKCRVELDLRDGASARWHIEVATDGELVISGSPTVKVQAQGTVELTRAPEAEVDAMVCARAEPGKKTFGRD